jgi:hypothetical protein
MLVLFSWRGSRTVPVPTERFADDAELAFCLGCRSCNVPAARFTILVGNLGARKWDPSDCEVLWRG